MTTTPSRPAPPALELATPVDDAGLLVHAEDAAAQLALSLVHLEHALAATGRCPADLAAVAVLAVSAEVHDEVADVLEERLEVTGAAPVVTTEVVDRLLVPGMLVALRPTLLAGPCSPSNGAAERSPVLMVVVAHPDDEAFGTGSVLAHAHRQGLRTVVVCATRGELGEPAPGSGLTPELLPQVRERELRSACALLGVERVEVLGYLDSGVDGDPAVGSLAAADADALRDRVAALVDDVRPDVVVTLDASDGHRDHAAVRDATIAALDVVTHRPGATYLSCLARSLMTDFTGAPDLGTPDDEITALVDVSDLLDLRWRAIRTHASQVPPFDAMDEQLQRGFLAVDRLRRVDPPWPGGPVEDAWLPRPPAARLPEPLAPTGAGPAVPPRRHTTEEKEPA